MIKKLKITNVGSLTYRLFHKDISRVKRGRGTRMDFIRISGHALQMLQNSAAH